MLIAVTLMKKQAFGGLLIITDVKTRGLYPGIPWSPRGLLSATPPLSPTIAFGRAAVAQQLSHHAFLF